MTSNAMKAHQAAPAIPQFTSKDYSSFFLAGMSQKDYIS
jgi:hypothetical protein